MLRSVPKHEAAHLSTHNVTAATDLELAFFICSDSDRYVVLKVSAAC